MSKINNGVLYRISAGVSGLILLYFGLNGIFGWVTPPPSTPEAGNLAMALAASGYVFPVVNAVFLIAGVSLIFNFWVPFAMILLAPITLNIILFHLVLAPMNMFFSVVLLVINLWVAFYYRKSFSGLFVTNRKD
ncbi:hypothetical protein CVV38_04125 [Candidatus Peregrinibacteria bacterium HGW-Peregrinibacteria-1]|jgi:hypothetical protein|nr:MAG: hypothetical protein CVV38_04125 [Candidatus Peregrinibacteria bacterium HGW-Peregrinibacteria-1]